MRMVQTLESDVWLALGLAMHTKSSSISAHGEDGVEESFISSLKHLFSSLLPVPGGSDTSQETQLCDLGLYALSSGVPICKVGGLEFLFYFLGE